MTTRNTHGLRNTFRWWAAAAALALVSLNANAYRGDKGLDLLFNQQGNTATGSFTGGGSGGLNYSSPSSTAVGVGKQKALPWPGKSQAENMAKWKGMAEKGNIAKAIIRPGGLLALGGSLAILPLLDAMCVRVFGGAMETSDGGQWEECNMVQTPGPGNWMPDNPPLSCGGSCTPKSSAQAACTMYKTEYIRRTDVNAVAIPHASFPNDPYRGRCNVTWSSNGSASPWSTDLRANSTVNTESQNGWKPIDEAALEAKLTSGIGSWTAADFAANYPENSAEAKGQKLLKELLDKGAKVELTDKPVLQCPASVEGSPVTETATEAAPAGGTRTKTTTKVNTYHYTSMGDSCVMSMTTKTTTSYSDGTPAEEEETSKTDERSRCEIDPQALGCGESLDLDTKEVPKTTKNVEFDVDDLGLGGGSCPAPMGFNTSKGNYALDLTQYCSMLSNVVKPLVLIAAALMALFIAVPRGD